MSDSEWLYHLTKKDNLSSIKSRGLVPRGQLPAGAEGATARDRRNREIKSVSDKLNGYIRDVIARGVALESIQAKQELSCQPGRVEITASKEDIVRLTAMENEALNGYCSPFGVIGRPRTWGAAFRATNKIEMISAANDLNSKGHFLASLAKTVISQQFDIEEAIADARVYFFENKFADDVFGDYTKTLGENIAVLRVARESVAVIQDESEYRAVCTTNAVPRKNIEVMNGDSNKFLDFGYRSNDENWESL